MASCGRKPKRGVEDARGDGLAAALLGKTYDRVRFNLTLDPAIPLKQQGRGYASLIWYEPAG